MTVLKENYALIVLSSCFKMKFKYPCVVRGFHLYRAYWNPITGETLDTEPEIDGIKFGNKHSVVVKKGVITLGHILKDISLLAKYFIIHGGTITCKITGKPQHSKMALGGLEVPCSNFFRMDGKDPILRRLKEKLNSIAKTWSNLLCFTTTLESQQIHCIGNNPVGTNVTSNRLWALHQLW